MTFFREQAGFPSWFENGLKESKDRLGVSIVVNGWGQGEGSCIWLELPTGTKRGHSQAFQSASPDVGHGKREG